MNRIHVIGIGYRPFTKKAREILLRADTILTSRRLFEVFQGSEEFEAVKEKITVITKINETMKFLHASFAARRPSPLLVLLASGDPLFFGIGRKVLAEFGHDRVEIHPDLSSVQLAFAAVREPWDDAFLMSLHGGPDPEKRRKLPYGLHDLPMLLERHGKIALLTDRENNPSVIANVLCTPLVTCRAPRIMHVCEKLGYPDEKITSGRPEEIATMSFSEPNVVIIKKAEVGSRGPETDDASPSRSLAPMFGLKEDEIHHSRGLITKDEVRAISIHKLRLPQKGIFWDIGAGSGSVSVETARLYPGLKVYAIEKNREQLSNIQENITAFGLPNIEVISGEAPDILTHLPPPDRVFIGGSSGKLSGIIGVVMEKMAEGIIVVNAISLETLNEAMRTLTDNGLVPEVSQVSVSRAKIVNGQRHMSALNPIFILRGERN